ncbi:MAG: LamG domain-containing protein [Chitinispirillaceae bacterium]|nr:LamG domain-containing protein [Chitinispirillaceae bacterium]
MLRITMLLMVITLISSLRCVFTTAGTLTESGSLSGTVLGQDSIPFENAMVVLRYENASGGRTLAKRLNYEINRMLSDTTYTEKQGRFFFRNLAFSKYHIEVTTSENRGAYTSIILDQDEKNAVLPYLICEPLGKLSGRVDVSVRDIVDSLYIRELDYMIAVDTAGYYSSRNIPAGTYTVSAVDGVNLVNSIYDNLELNVEPGDTTNSLLLEDSIAYADSVAYADSLGFATDSFTIAQWAFNDRAGGIITDFSGNGYHLTIVDPVNIVLGRYSNAIDLSDTGYVYIFPKAAFFTPYVKVEAVVLANTLPVKDGGNRAHEMIVSTNGFGLRQTYGYELRLSDSTGCPEFAIGTANGWQLALSPNGLEIGTWYTLTGMFDGSMVSISVDGEMKAVTPYSGSIHYQGIDTCAVGRRYNDRAMYFNGIIDEVRISTISP